MFTSPFHEGGEKIILELKFFRVFFLSDLQKRTQIVRVGVCS